MPADRRLIDPHPFHVVGEKYLTALSDAAGALPLMIPALGERLDAGQLLETLDGLLLTGSPSNVEPHHYGGERSIDGTLHDPHRDETTLPLITAALDEAIPILALCRGFQELNVALGGTLHQRVHEIPGYGMHKENRDDPVEAQYGPSHFVNLCEGGQLRSLAGVDRVQVNSLHSQGVAKLAAGVSVEAVADDGLIEGFRVDRDGFALAIQWHPEWRVKENAFSTSIFQAFGDACRRRSARRSPVHQV
ncbi:MAG TPA: gamma-glutamyl-gamma-aminobutyrate hydrolase family protein [Woeseiaceae bacterium]|nr:gamma-glutamyl-gamma-aminobutyrate hydrolase family protein [Woeseiaceae bacterium]